MEKTERLKYIDEIYDNLCGLPCKANADAGRLVNPEIIEDLNSLDMQMLPKDRKKQGSFYTDISIVEYMIDLIFCKIDITDNPYIRILDPSCGCGFFLTGAYDILKKKYEDSLDNLNKKHPGLNLDAAGIHEHILTYNLFGCDIDEYAVKLSIINLMAKNKEDHTKPNIICCDSLLNAGHTLIDRESFLNQRFDIILGNPPYLGHKEISGKYRKTLQGIYGDIFKGKSDVSFCFLKSSIERLAEGGKLCFIMPRYFLESPSGMGLRSYIRQSCTIKKIVDFYGVRVMKGISVDPVIIYIEKSVSGSNAIDVSKGKSQLKGLSCSDALKELKEKSSYYKSFVVLQHSLKDEGWVLWDSDATGILCKIERNFTLSLSDVCRSFQGIITGCDRAFIVDDSIIERYGIERSITRPWIKNSSVKKYRVEGCGKLIIYSDFIVEPEEYSSAISYISMQKDRLESRRECIRGLRRWYQLQWGRTSSLFDMKKIIFPYKSRENRFAIDSGSYSSADIYGMYIKPQYNERITYEYICGLLNSKLYEFYFKSFGKKLGDDLYEYYPNTVMRLKIPCFQPSIGMLVKDLLTLTDEGGKEGLMKKIDGYIYDMAGLSEREIETVERGIEI